MTSSSAPSSSTKKSDKKKRSSKKHHHPHDPPGFSDIELGPVGVGINNHDFTLDESHEDNKLPLANDPFAPREGKTLLWRNVNMTLKGKNGAEDKELLKDVWGEVPQKQTTAIMGPSGAGKTSLLNILAGRASTRGQLSIESDIRVNNVEVDPTDINIRQSIAFVAQDDSLMATSTPREAIYFSAKLRLPESTPEGHLHMLVDRMLEELGLSHCADTIVGGPLLKGISGGERKRTSIGVELVVKPTMIFLDEPTSGLDSYSAVQLCRVLKKVANSGASVLFTIHQPASEIFNAFDSLILMNKGQVMYQGPVLNVPTYFKKRGHRIPQHWNSADWIMHVAQSVPMETLESQGYFPKDTRTLAEPEKPTFEKRSSFSLASFTRRNSSTEADESSLAGSTASCARRFDTIDSRSSLLTQTRMLLARELKNLKRDKQILGGRLTITTVLATLVGTIFYDVGQQSPSIVSNLNSQFGALTMVLMASMFGTAQPALLGFPQERPVFLREYSTNHYSVVSYFLSRLTVEILITAIQVFLLVMVSFWMIGFNSDFAYFYINVYCLAMTSTALAVLLGCSVEDPKLAQEMLPVLFVPQLLFAGFFVTPSLMPEWLRWARYIFALTYSVKLGLIGEFEDCQGGEMAEMNCNNLLDSIEADPDEAWWYWVVLGVLFVSYRTLALLNLRRKATKFF